MPEGPRDRGSFAEGEELLGPEVVFDPRCHAPGRFVGTSLPPGVEPWLRALSKNTTAEIMARYPGLVSPKRAAVLKTMAVQPSVYFTPEIKAEFESQARANLAHECSLLAAYADILLPHSE